MKKDAWMKGVGFFMSSKDLVCPINTRQEYEKPMWSLLCLIANKSSDFIFKSLSSDCGCILRPWIRLPALMIPKDIKS